MANGLITRKDIIEDQALTIGTDYAKNMQPAIEANKQLVASLKEMAPLVNAFRKTDSQQAYIALKQQENLTTLQAINANKLLEASELSLEKIKKEKLQTSKSQVDLDVRKAKASSELSRLIAVEEKLNQEKLKTEKEKIAVEKQLTDLEIKKQQLKNAGISVSKAELDLIQKEESIKRNKLKLLQDEENKIKSLQIVSQKNTSIWKEQNQLELALISTKKKNELATEGTNRALAKERVLLAEANKGVKLQAREQLGLVTTYERLNRARTEAQKRLANLLSAEVKNNAEIKVAQREYQILDVRVKAVDAATKNYTKNIGNYGSAFEGVNGKLKELISTFGLVTGVALFGTIMKDIFFTIKDFDRQLIAVGKTTNISGEGLKQFGREVVDLGSDLDGISIDGLLRSAEVAGTLGVKGTDNILKFSTAIEKLKLTSDIISDEQVQNFAKFIEVSSDSFENADRLASVITELGNNMATTEAQVLSNATEIQKGIAVYETSAEGVLGLGAATSALGSEAESSRSAIQSTFAILNKATATGANLEKVLKLTGLTQKELSDQFNKDATGVFKKFVKGLSNAKDEGQNLSLVLEDLGITEKRAFTVIGSLAANYGVLENAMSLANAEYVNNIALNKEVEAASQSIASIIGDIKDEFEAYVLATNDANSGTELITKTLKFFRDNLKDIITGFLKYGSVIVTFIAVQKALNFITLTYNALKVAGVAAQISFTTATGIGTVAMKAQALAAQEAAAAQTALNVATKATPWGIIIALLLATTVAYAAFNDELSKSEKLLLKINDQTKQLQETEANYNKQGDASRDKRFKSIEDEMKLRRAKGESTKKLDEEEIALKKAVVQADIDQYNDLKKQEIERTKTQIQQSEIRIAQLTKEGNVLAKSGFRVSKQGRTGDEITDLVANEKEKLKVSKSALFQNSKITVEEQKRLNDLLNDLNKDKAVKDASAQQEENEKAKRAREKRLKEAYDAEKKAQENLFKLSQFRLQVAIDMDEEILKNDKTSLDNRVDALTDYQQFVTAKTKEAAEYELSQLGTYNEKTGKLVRELSNSEIQILLDEGTIKKKLTSEQLLILEKYQNEQTQLKKKGVEERQKIIDSQVESMQKQLDKELLGQSTKVQESLLLESEQYKTELQLAEDNYILLEKARKDHEDRISKITSDAKKEQLLTEIDAIQKILDSEKARTDGSAISIDKIKKLENELATYRKELSLENTNETEKNITKRVELEKEANDRIVDLQFQLKDALIDLANTIFDARIQKIDNEIDKNNEYYEKQMELAGNDERQKEALEKQRAKKEKELQKEKQKEIVKAAIFNKVMSIATIAIQTAMAAAAALAPPPIGLGPVLGGTLLPYIISLGAIQAGIVAATPIPKYKMGRKGGPAEVAVVGDGGVSEVVSRPDGSGARITPNKPTLTFLQQDDVVHKSMADFNQYKRNAIMKGFYKEKELAGSFQMMGGSNDNSDLINEMRLTRETIKKQKTNVQVINKIDFGHEMYRRSNINWRN